MSQRSIASGVVLPTVAAAVITSVIAIAVTFATAWRDNLWAWLAVGILTMVSAGVSVWLYRQQAHPDPGPGATGANEAEIGRKANVGLVEQFGGVASKLKVGARARVETVRMGAVPTGSENPPAETASDPALPYRASSPYYRQPSPYRRGQGVPPGDDDSK